MNAAEIKAWTLQRDIEASVALAQAAWEPLRGARLFITGGTGFIGCWLLETLRHANLSLGLGIEATILTRDPERFAAKLPRLGRHPDFTFIAGDVKNFAFPAGGFTHLVHAATDASADLNETNPRQMFDTVLTGTRRALDFAVEKNVSRVLNLSSGAVYGRQPRDLVNVPESWPAAPDCTDPVNSYGEGKRAAEMLCAIYGKQFGLPVSTARIFALLGPYLSLDIHFAAGNFIRDAMEGRPVVVKGDGLAHRSYLYAGDLTAQLWLMLAKAPGGRAYNIGSDETISIGALAERIAGLLGREGFRILGRPDAGWNPGRYVPDTQLASQDLGLYKTVTLDDAIMRTAIWHGWKPWH